MVTYAELAARVRAADARCGRTRVVAVDGPSGSGKTGIAARLAGALGGAPVLPMDDLYPGWDGLAAGVSQLVAQVLEPLARGEHASYRQWDWHRSRWDGPVRVPAGDTLVVDGCGSGSRAVAPYLSLLVWVDAPTELRMRRGIDRDGETFRPHWQRWSRQERALFAAENTAGRADVRVDGAPTVTHDQARELVVR